MRFVKAWAKNALIYQDVHYCLQNQGIVLVTGENKDEAKSTNSSNGAGKSALFELIPLMLYDRPTRWTTKDSLFLESTKPLEVGLEFQNGQDRYTVVLTRTANKGSLTIKKNGQDITPRGGLPIARKLLKKAIPMSEDVYYTTVHITPTRLSPFIEGTPQSRYKFLAQLIGLDSIDVMKEALQNKIEELRSKMPSKSAKEIEEEIERIKESLPPEIDVSFLCNWQEKIQSWRNYLAYHIEQDQQILRYSTAIRALKDKDVDIDSLEKAYYRAKARLDELLRLKKQVERAVEQRAAWARLSEKYPDLPLDLRETYVRLQELEHRQRCLQSYLVAENLREVVKKESGLDLAELSHHFWEDLEAQANLALHRRGRYAERLELLEEERDSLEELLHQAEDPKVKCPTCGTVLTKEQLKQRIQDLEKKIADARQEYEKYKAEARRLSDLRRYARFYYKYRSLMEQLPEDFKAGDDPAAELNYLGEKIEAFKKAYQLLSISDPKIFRAGGPAVKRLLQAVRWRQELVKSLKRRYKMAKNLERSRLILKSYGWRGESFQEVKTRLEKNIKKEEILKKWYDFIWEVRIKVGNLAGQYARAEKQIKHLKRQLPKAKECERQLRVYQDVLKLLGTGGLKKRIVNYYLDRLVFWLRHFSSYLFRRIDFSVRSRGNSLYIEYKVGKKVGDIRTMSSGQKKRLLLALVPSLVKTLPPSSRSNILILDEIDANVDKLGLERMEEFIPRLKKDFESIFILTPSMGRFRSYDRHWHVIRKNGVSKLKILKGGVAK